MHAQTGSWVLQVDGHYGVVLVRMQVSHSPWCAIALLTYNNKIVIAVHKTLANISLEFRCTISLWYSYIAVTTALWFVARQPNLIRIVDRYMSCNGGEVIF